jgi:ribonuclease P protein component
MHATKDIMKIISPLTQRADFLCLGKSKDKWVSKTLILQAMPRDPATAPEGLPEDHIRFGLTITKRTFKSAVKRNRIKRRLRALCYDVLGTQARRGCDYVIIGRTETLTAPYGVIEKDLIWCLKRMGYLNHDD